jgi:DNA-directed RNA polymerase specialized sigma24 family protein
LTPEEFDKLLIRLDADREQAGVQYNHLHGKLVNYFRFKGLSSPEDAADETLDRVGAKLWGGEEIRDVEGYSFGVARIIALEHQRKQARKLAALDVLKYIHSLTLHPDERVFNLMRRCLSHLPAKDRDLIAKYFVEASGDDLMRLRLELAEKLEVTLNTLRLRIHRLRLKLESCLLAGMRLLE